MIGNAIKYNKDHGQVFVDIEAQGDGMKIVVEDTGIGIPLADQGRVLKDFIVLIKEEVNNVGEQVWDWLLLNTLFLIIRERFL